MEVTVALVTVPKKEAGKEDYSYLPELPFKILSSNYLLSS